MIIASLAPMSTSIQEDLKERVSRRAYEIYEAEGRQSGRELEHWCQAENEILQTLVENRSASDDLQTIPHTLAVKSDPTKRSKSGAPKGVGIRQSL